MAVYARQRPVRCGCLSKSLFLPDIFVWLQLRTYGVYKPSFHNLCFDQNMDMSLFPAKRKRGCGKKHQVQDVTFVHGTQVENIVCTVYQVLNSAASAELECDTISMRQIRKRVLCSIADQRNLAICSTRNCSKHCWSAARLVQRFSPLPKARSFTIRTVKDGSSDTPAKSQAMGAHVVSSMSALLATLCVLCSYPSTKERLHHNAVELLTDCLKSVLWETIVENGAADVQTSAVYHECVNVFRGAGALRDMNTMNNQPHPANSSKPSTTFGANVEPTLEQAIDTLTTAAFDNFCLCRLRLSKVAAMQ